MKKLNKMVILIILNCMVVTGCASHTNGVREVERNLVKSCSSTKTTYLAATAEDMTVIFIPLFSLAGKNSCSRFTTSSCQKLNSWWPFSAPFATVDIPFALAMDIYEIPGDIRHNRMIKKCNQEKINKT